MKKAVAAGVLLLAMLGGFLWSSHVLDAAVGEMTEQAEECRRFCRIGDLGSAEDSLSRATESWERLGFYGRVFLRQTETDAVEEALREVLDCLRNGERESAEVALDWLERRLLSLAEMERVSWGSVF